MEKIIFLDIDGVKPFSVDIEENECIIKDYRIENFTVSYIEAETKKEAIYKTVVEFIKWYNNINNNNII